MLTAEQEASAMMPRGPRGEKRPADVIGTAIMVAKIATGEIEEELGPSSQGEDKAGEGARRAAHV